MKITIKLLSLIMLGMISGNLFAHFGSKGPFGGSANCAAIYDTNVVYIGTKNGGVFESTTTGLTAWRARPVGLKSGKITALTHSGSYLFAGTADSGVFIFNGYVGSDRYWNKINNGLENRHITSLLALDSITVLAGCDSGVFMTTDKGASWTAVNNGIHHMEVTGIVKAGNRLIHISHGGVWASDDTATTWMDFNDVNTDHIETHLVSYNKNGDELLILNDNGLWIADTISTVSVPDFAAANTGLPMGVKIRYISNNGTHWFLATDMGVYVSAVGSISWTVENTGLSAEATDVNVVIPFRTSLVLGTNSEGNFKSSATSISWSAYNTSYNNQKTHSMITAGVNFVVAVTEKGVFVSKDLATTYVKSNTGLTDSLHVMDITIMNGNLYAATLNNGVFMSADSGKTWSTMNNGLPAMPWEKIYTSGNELFVVCSMGHICQYVGNSWYMMMNGLPMMGLNPTSMAFNGNNVLLGTLGNGVYMKDLDTAAIWTQMNTGLTNLDVTSVTSNGEKIFAGTAGDGVFVSDTAIVSWSQTAPLSIAHTTMLNLDGTHVQAMAFYDGYVFASYKGGLLASSDNGVTWIAGGNQFNLPSYTDVNKITFVTTRVFVTTENNGLYSNGLAELPSLTGIENIAANKSDLRVYPNPSNGSIVIKGEGVLDVTIFDIAGRVLDHKTNVQANQQLNLNYVAGTYMVQVKEGDVVSMHKLIVE